MFEIRRHPARAVVAAVILAAALAAGLMMTCASPASAQDWRTVSSARQQADESSFDVKLEYGAGQLRIEPSQDGSLYRTKLRYNADMFRPVTEFEAGRLKVGLEGRGNIRDIKSRGARLDLQLGAGTELDLDFDFGAVDAEMELGGLDIRNLEISTGASDTRLSFTQPNTRRMDRMSLELGAASFRAEGLANARIDRLHVAGGVGDIVLDFSGEWDGTTDVEVGMGLGSLTLRLPRGVGVRLSKKSFLASVDTDGLTKRGGDYYSSSWDEATRRLTLDVTTAFGSVDIDWIDGGDAATAGS